jgi:hypothetical protein
MRYFTGFLIAIGLIVLIFVIILKGGGSKTPQQQVDLNSYANSEAIVQLTISGPVSADQTHFAEQISVGRSQSTFNLIQGYQGNIKNSKSYQNNQDAFTVFLRALSLIGFTKGNSDPKLSNSNGYCPDGEVYTFQLLEGSDTIQNYWSSSCGGGTYQGNTTETLTLFERQIPDYDNLTADVAF